MKVRTKHFDALKQSIMQMKAIERGNAKPGRRYTAVEVLGAERVALIEARKKTGLSQSEMAELMGVSARTLQDWEQGRRTPTGAAKTLIFVAAAEPEAVLKATARMKTASAMRIPSGRAKVGQRRRAAAKR